MNTWKVLFFYLLFIWVITLCVSLWTIKDINESLDKVDAYIIDDQITKYHEAGWLPYSTFKEE